MGEDTRAANEGSVDEAGLRTSSAAARRAAGNPGQARAAGRNDIKPVELDEAQLTAWGNVIGASVVLPVVFALRGDLGAGKSVLARAIARGAGVNSSMPSPTFNLLFEYTTPRGVISHLDLYRLERPDEVWEIGWWELGEGEQIVLIEWPERAEALLPEPRWDVYIEPSAHSPDLRQVSATPIGNPNPIPIPIP